MKLSQKLQRIIKRDTGIDVDTPVSINRGYWKSYEGSFRWTAREIGGARRVFVCEDSMTLCVKHGVEPEPRTPFHCHQEWFMDRKS